ncbi:hypothetical protein ACFY7C_36830 [Streptomyces sp. NPDC012769]|uniref:hypothetical protein n=1 Tax=Streptomyces sp. NPDC012769 TaxID=3364848 RepID=UPI003681D4FD
MSRVQILETPILAPGKCVLCGSAGGDHRKFIDLGMKIDFYGRVYFCSYCIQEVLQKLEYVTAENFDNLHDSYRSLNTEYDRLKVEHEAVKNALNNLLSSSTFGELPRIHPNGDEVPEGYSRNESSDMGVSEDSAEGDPEAEQSTSVEGSDDLFDSSDFDDGE